MLQREFQSKGNLAQHLVICSLLSKFQKLLSPYHMHGTLPQYHASSVKRQLPHNVHLSFSGTIEHLRNSVANMKHFYFVFQDSPVTASAAG